jgi:Flp pilus assembly protein TadG
MSPLLKLARRCEQGAVAVEFALMMPFLFLLHFGAVEMIQAWGAHRRAAHVAAALADLTAQSRSVTTANLDDIMAAGAVMLAPYPADTLGERIASLTMGADGKVSNDWTVTKNWTAGGSPSAPAGYLQPGESVIVAHVTYEHKALFGLVLPGVTKMEKVAYLRPRLSNQVTKAKD